VPSRWFRISEIVSVLAPPLGQSRTAAHNALGFTSLFLEKGSNVACAMKDADDLDAHLRLPIEDKVLGKILHPKHSHRGVPRSSEISKDADIGHRGQLLEGALCSSVQPVAKTPFSTF
jgi:hypothetical protein